VDWTQLYITDMLPVNVDILICKSLIFLCVHKLKTSDKYIKANTAISKTPKGETRKTQKAMDFCISI
jgi:hypothetical protein